MFSKMFNYFASSSKTYLDNTQESAINCGQHSAEAASYAVKTLPQILSRALYDAGSIVYEGTLCAVNGAAAAAATFVYDNVYSTDVQLSGNAIEAVL